MAPAGKNLLSVEDALARVLDGATRLGHEIVSVYDALGRTLAEPVIAKRTQPPFASSAMDGYAVIAADATVGAQLEVIGEAAAGHLYEGRVKPGQAVRIFTGGAVPDGADAILIQENAARSGTRIHVREAAKAGQHIRAAGIDFKGGDLLIPAGSPLSTRALALAAATGHLRLQVACRPRVAVLATGDELVSPDAVPGPAQITASNSYMVAGVITAACGAVIDLGIAPDNLNDIQTAVRTARKEGADVLITTGGASVGERDLVQEAFKNEGMKLEFWRIAMRPGRPIMYGRIGDMRVIGLPGNPVSAYTGAMLFAVPLLRALQGRSDIHHPLEHAVLGTDLPANDWRADYLRAKLSPRADAAPVAMPFPRQDSSMMRVLAEAECLIVRPVEEPARKAGDPCQIIRLGTNS
jgi:molybdopterin molybdotransferase